MTKSLAKSRDVHARKCIVTNESAPREGLIRFVRGPEDIVIADIYEKLPGRGVWVAASRATLETAIAKNAFSRAFKANVTVSPQLLQQTEDALAQKLVQYIALARKSGQAVAGVQKVKSWLADGKARVLIQANDGSQREKSALRPPKGKNSYFQALTKDELGMAFGREIVIHAALTGHGLVERIQIEAGKLETFRNRETPAAMGKRNKD